MGYFNSKILIFFIYQSDILDFSGIPGLKIDGLINRYMPKSMSDQIDQSWIHTTDPQQLKSILDKYGVAILDNYFTPDYADTVFHQVKTWLINLNIGLTDNESTWTPDNTPAGPRYGLYQSIISHCPTFWELREKMYPIFSLLHSTPDLLTSIDGASFYPGCQKPSSKQDWAHIDQTVSSQFMCYQAQFVATDTSASLVATLGSHLLHDQVVALSNISHKSGNWHKFTKEEVIHLKKIFSINYQRPIVSKKGAIIFWDSRTIHSAKYQDPRDTRWRAVFYISMRPSGEFSETDKKLLIRAATEGRTTNHWGNKIFDTKTRFITKNPQVARLLKNLSELSYLPNMNPVQKRLIGL